MKIFNEELAKKFYDSMMSDVEKPTTVHMQILRKDQIERCSESLRRTKALFCEYGDDVDPTQPGTKAKTIFIVDHLTFDNKGNLTGRVTPHGDLWKMGERWIKQRDPTYQDPTMPIFTFTPRFVVNNRNWRSILKLEVKLKSK